MGTTTTIRHLFDGKRRQCTLSDCHPLKDKSKVRRMKMIIRQSLSLQPFEGMPEEFSEEVNVMLKQDSLANFKKIFVKMDGAKLSVFSTDTVKTSVWNTNGAALNGFKLLGDGIGEKRNVQLEFTAYVPWSDKVKDWCGDHLHEDFYLEAVPSQMEIPAEIPAEKPAGKKKNGKVTDFDPAAVQKAAKAGELQENVL